MLDLSKTKSEWLLETFIERILKLDKLINAVADERFFDALRKARKLDADLKFYYGDKAQLLEEKPFYGVPLSVKESIAVEGEFGLFGTSLQNTVRNSA